MKRKRKQREIEFKEKLIIEAAEKIICKKGFDKTRMKDIANAAHYSKGSLYSYFKSKNELCLALITKLLNEIYNDISETQGIESALSIYLDFLENHPFANEFFIRFRLNKEKCVDSLGKFSKINNQIREKFKELIDNSRDKSNFIDSENLVEILWGELNGILPGIVLRRSQTDNIKEKKENLIRFVMNGISN